MLIQDPVERISPIVIGSSLGGGNDIYAGKAGGTLQFNTLAEGTGINMSLVSNLLTITVDETDLSYWSGIGGLNDVDTTGVADDDLFQYDSGSGDWIVRSRREILRNNAGDTTIPDNTATTLLTLDKTVSDSLFIGYSAYRESSVDSEVVKQGILFCKYRPTSDDWIVSEMTVHDDPNDIGLSWAFSGQALQYTATDYTDTSYASHMRYTILGETRV